MGTATDTTHYYFCDKCYADYDKSRRNEKQLISQAENHLKNLARIYKFESEKLQKIRTTLEQGLERKLIEIEL